MKVEAGLAGGGSLGMVGWLRSSSQEPMVAARLARRPLLPIGAPEGAGASTCGATSGSLLMGDRVASSVVSGVNK